MLLLLLLLGRRTRLAGGGQLGRIRAHAVAVVGGVCLQWSCCARGGRASVKGSEFCAQRHGISCARPVGAKRPPCIHSNCPIAATAAGQRAALALAQRSSGVCWCQLSWLTACRTRRDGHESGAAVLLNLYHHHVHARPCSWRTPLLILRALCSAHTTSRYLVLNSFLNLLNRWALGLYGAPSSLRTPRTLVATPPAGASVHRVLPPPQVSNSLSS